jgi:hypothetical protein
MKSHELIPSHPSHSYAPHYSFSDEGTFHIIGKANKHSVHIWGTEQPHAQTEHRRDSPKVNVFCAVPCENVRGPFVFTEAIVTGD